MTISRRRLFGLLAASPIAIRAAALAPVTTVAQVGFPTCYTSSVSAVYGLGYMITREILEDDLYVNLRST